MPSFASESEGLSGPDGYGSRVFDDFTNEIYECRKLKLPSHVADQVSVAYCCSHAFVRRGMKPSSLCSYSKGFCSYCSVNFKEAVDQLLLALITYIPNQSHYRPVYQLVFLRVSRPQKSHESLSDHK